MKAKQQDGNWLWEHHRVKVLFVHPDPIRTYLKRSETKRISWAKNTTFSHLMIDLSPTRFAFLSFARSFVLVSCIFSPKLIISLSEIENQTCHSCYIIIIFFSSSSSSSITSQVRSCHLRFWRQSWNLSWPVTILPVSRIQVRPSRTRRLISPNGSPGSGSFRWSSD